MRISKLLLISTLLILSHSMMLQICADSDYFGIYPTVSKRDVSYTFGTCNFIGISTAMTNNLECITSSAEQDSSGNVSPYVSQVYAMYQYSNSRISLHSEVHYVDSSGNSQYISCETQTGCTNIGMASKIGNVTIMQFWNGDHIKYYVEVYDRNDNSINSYFNPDYIPSPDDTSSKFASGTQIDAKTGINYKFTQWGIEGMLPNPPSGWHIEQSGMSTFYGSTSYPLASDHVHTTDPESGYINGSYVTHRIIPPNDYRIIIGDNKYCVHRNNNDTADIKWQDGPACLSAGIHLW